MKIKICGNRRSEDIDYINMFLPDYAGFILAKGFKRTVEPADAKFFCAKTDSRVKKVGVFVNQSIESVVSLAEYTGIDIIQLHGNEDDEYISKLRKLTSKEIWNVFHIKDVDEIKKAEKSKADKILLDTYSEKSVGGTGEKARTDIIIKSNISREYILAGGLNEDNLFDTAKELNPYAVDLSSGIETNGIKDADKIANVIKIIRSQF